MLCGRRTTIHYGKAIDTRVDFNCARLALISSPGSETPGCDGCSPRYLDWRHKPPMSQENSTGMGYQLFLVIQMHWPATLVYRTA